jgi:hypothetical protein
MMTIAEKARCYDAIMAAVYIEDCHVTGMHDPGHTPYHMCELQLRDLAVRVLAVTHGMKTGHNHSLERRIHEANKVPRQLNRAEGSWYEYHRARRNKTAAGLLAWERDGFKRRPVL